MSTPQIPPADRLAEVRAQRKALEAEENSLRNLMLHDPSARTGNSYCVEIEVRPTNRTDYKELQAAYPDIYAQYTHPIDTTFVVLKGISEDGEIVSLRKKATAQ